MRILMESYDYLFFRLWKWHHKYFGESDMPHLNAVLNLGVLAVLNWMTFALGFEVLFGIQIVGFTKIEGFFSVLVIGIIMYLIFFYEQRYKTIIDRFKTDGAERQQLRGFLSTAYPVVTFLLWMVTAFFAWGINNR